MVPITFVVNATDNCSSTITSQITHVSSNEPETGGGDNTTPDFEITGPLSVTLRAERSESGLGRVYTIGVRSTDEAGNYTDRVGTVFVPKSQKGKSQAEL